MRLDGPNPAGQRMTAMLADGSYWTYSYDALSQATVTGADPRRLEFLYDAKGRRRSRTLVSDISAPSFAFPSFDLRCIPIGLPSMVTVDQQRSAIDDGNGA